MISWDVLSSSYLEYKIIRYWGLLQVVKRALFVKYYKMEKNVNIILFFQTFYKIREASQDFILENYSV